MTSGRHDNGLAGLRHPDQTVVSHPRPPGGRSLRAGGDQIVELIVVLRSMVEMFHLNGIVVSSVPSFFCAL